MKKAVLIVSLLIITFLFIRGCYESEIRRTNQEVLSKEEIHSIVYPWSIKPGLVTTVTKYKEAYDTDSNDWIAHFFLDPREIQSFSKFLIALPPNIRTLYRCVHANAKDWASEDVCSAEKMESNGFSGFFYNPSLCKEGCKQNIILWVNPSSGEAYIVGSPDYD